VELTIILNIAITIGALAFAALCIYLIITIAKLRKSFVRTQENIEDISRSAVPMFENLTAITDKVKNITENVDDEIAVLKSSVESIREMTDDILSFEKKIHREIEGPVMEAFSFVAALVKGVKAFVAKMKE